MKIGICTSADQILKMEAMGFDYIEPAAAALASMTEEAFLKARALVEAAGICCEAFNVLFPGDIKLVGPDVSEEKIAAYLEHAFSRVQALGGEVVVFGSGGARKIPVGWDGDQAITQLISAARLVGDAASQHGLIIAMEPLNKGETNNLNSVAEGIAFVKKVNHPNVQLLADFYHMQVEREPMEVLKETEGLLRHTHIANSHGRVYPLHESEDSYAEFISNLKAAGYSGRMSVEAGTQDPDQEGPAALTLLRRLTM